jgi:hypothetical protein
VKNTPEPIALSGARRYIPQSIMAFSGEADTGSRKESIKAKDMSPGSDLTRTEAMENGGTRRRSENPCAPKSSV